jgi:hypothetical protein
VTEGFSPFLIFYSQGRERTRESSHDLESAQQRVRVLSTWGDVSEVRLYRLTFEEIRPPEAEGDR